MSNEKPQVFIDIVHEDLHKKIEEYDARGWRFVNICGSTVEEGVELIYSFSQGLPLENLRFTIDNDTEISSVSDLFPSAFFFENETHDLFGVRFSGISIDFDGEFYTVAVPTPMNPRSAEARHADANNTYGAADYGACGVPAASVILSEAKDLAGDSHLARDIAVVLPNTSAEGGEQ
jgi:ech hydrogenase subunit D